MIDSRFISEIAKDTSATPEQVAAVLQLSEEGAGIPFVLRYRRDLTGNLSQQKLEAIVEHSQRLKGLIQRRTAIIETLSEQGSLSDELRQSLDACSEKEELEDLYRPYKEAKPSRAVFARENGLQPLADLILNHPPEGDSIEEMARSLVDAEKGVSAPEQAIEGALHIIAEHVSMDSKARALVRNRMRSEGKIVSHSTKNAEGKKTKFQAFYDFSETLKTIPSHRMLALSRGVKAGLLRMELDIDDAAMLDDLVKLYADVADTFFEKLIRVAVEDTYTRTIRPAVELEVLGALRKRADTQAIGVFRKNAESLLLAAPAGAVTAMGVEAGMDSGCHAAIVDAQGRLLESIDIAPFPPPEDQRQAVIDNLVDLLGKSGVSVAAVGNGKGSREASKLVNEAFEKIQNKRSFSMIVSQAGAAAYAASKLAQEEFPELDAPMRVAVSIARRLQDPLRELAKIEPRSIGVGQYQHDVNQKLLREGLQATVAACVNRVGVDLNTAPAELLAYVSGLNKGAAERIVAYRTEHEDFKSRAALLEVEGITPRMYELCAGFLRIDAGDNALDGTAIHPDAYPVVEKMAASIDQPVEALIRNREAVNKIQLEEFTGEGWLGLYTLKDIRRELLHPASDPRGKFRVPKPLEGVNNITDLQKDMEIEGIVSNVTAFGAFVDMGVGQDGLVHLSELANRFVRDPRDIVHVGQVVKVKVMEVDLEAPRISLSIKALQPPPKKRVRRSTGRSEAAAAKSAPDRSDKEGEGERSRGRGTEERDGAPRPARPSRGPAGDSRPDRGPDNRSDRARTRGPKRPKRDNGKPPRDSNKRRAGQTIVSGDSSGPMNTQLADQLEALRQKLQK